MKKENKEKIKIDKRQLFGRIMAGFLLIAMLLASCSTVIYYVIANIK